MYNYYDFEQFKADEILAYLRKSRTDDPLLTVEEVLAKHEAILDEWAERNIGCVVPEENKYREVVSGETIADRPEMQTILKKIESPKIKAILTVEVQRLSRGDLEDAGRLIKLLRYTNTIVITPQKVYDLKDEYDRDAFERELKRGNEFLEYQKKIMNRGKLLSVSQGNFVNSIPPYGYDKVWITEGKRKCPTLAINEDEALVVRMIFNMYVNDDMGCNNICHTLDDLGIKPPKGKIWSPNGVRDILRNITYTGKVVWERRKTIRVVEDSEISKTRPRASLGEHLVYDGKHEAIISEELFEAAREKQGRKHKAKSTTKVRNPLAGILYCQCGRAMSMRTYKSHNGKPRLLCDDQVHCKTGSVLYDEMLSTVCDILTNSIADFEIKKNHSDVDSAKLHDKMIKSLEKRLHEIEARELSQWEAQSDPDPSKRMPQAIFKQLNEKLLKEKDEVQEALLKAYSTKPNPVDYEAKIVKFRDALDALQNPDMDAAKKNSLLKDCIERINYSRERPERVKNTEKKTYRNGREDGKGRRLKPNPLKTGATWTNPPVEIEVKLKV